MIALYILLMFSFVIMVVALIKKPFEAFSSIDMTGYAVRLHTDGAVIVGAVLEYNGGKVCTIMKRFANERDATNAVLTKYYRELEAEYIARTRRVNYAMGDRQTVTRIKRMFAHTLKGRELLELMEEVNENVNSAKDN